MLPAERKKQQLAVVISVAAWLGYPCFLFLVYGVIWPGQWDAITVAYGSAVATYALVVVLRGLKRALFSA